MERVDISDLDKAEVLAAVYNKALPFGMGYIQADPLHVMSTGEAREILATRRSLYFDYYRGRLIKIDFAKDKFLSCAAFDRDYGDGALQEIVDSVRLKNTD